VGCPGTWNAVHLKQFSFFSIKFAEIIILLITEIKFIKFNYPILTSTQYTRVSQVVPLFLQHQIKIHMGQCK